MWLLGNTMCFFDGLGGFGLEALEEVQTLEGEEALMEVENLPEPSV